MNYSADSQDMMLTPLHLAAGNGNLECLENKIAAHGQYNIWKLFLETETKKILETIFGRPHFMKL